MPQNDIVYNVTEARLTIPAFTLGVDLEAPVQIKFGGTAEAPAVDTAINISAGSSIAVATNSGYIGTSSISVTIPAGQRMSKIFYVQGVGPGATSLNYGDGPYFSTPVTVRQTAFVIQEAASGKPLNLKVGDTANLTIVPVTLPPTDSALSPLIVRPGVQPVAVVTASTSPSVASVSPLQVNLNPGDHQAIVTVKALATGTTTIKLLGDRYDFSQPQSSTIMLVR